MSERTITTVRELIARLSEMPPDLPVLVPGYEGGLCDADGPELVCVQWDQHSEWYYGPHEEDAKAPEKNAVCISGLGNHLSRT